MLRKLFGRKRKPQYAPSQNASATDSIRVAVVGDVLVIKGLSLEYDDAYFFIEQVDRYEGPAGTSYELVAADGDNKVWVEWSDEDGLHITAADNRRPWSLASLALTEDDLIRLDEDQSIDNHVTVEDRRYFYRHSFEAYYFKNGRGPGEGFYLWDFVAEDDGGALSITKWEGLPFEGFFSQIISPHGITLYKRDPSDSQR